MPESKSREHILMHNNLLKIFTLTAAIITTPSLTAGEAVDTQPVVGHQQPPKEIDLLKANLAKVGMEGNVLQRMMLSNDLIALRYENGSIYITNKQGDLFIGSDPSGLQIVYEHEGLRGNASDEMNISFRASLLKQLPNYIEYKSDNEKYIVYAFIDPACGYCDLMHSQLNEYLDAGITLRYLPFVIFGEKSAQAMQRVFELPADEQADALSSLKEALSLSSDLKDDNVAKYIEQSTRSAQAMGFNGTPALLMGDGNAFPSYVPADALLERIQALYSE
jgi:thiol:disulfide interchange protein DsbC